MKHWMRNLAAALMIAAAAWLPSAGMPVFAKTAPTQAAQVVLDPDDPINDIPVDDLPAPEGTLDGMPQQPLEDILTEYTPENMDDRQKVADTAVFPYSAICKLHMYFYDETTQETKHFIGSGFLITPTTVLTCAHCVYDVEHNYKDVRRVIVSPGCTNTSDPYGMHDSANGEVTKILYEPGYEKQGSSSLDCALIQLSTPVGDQAGYIRLSTGAMSSDQLQISGYPAEVRGTVDDDNQYHAWGAPVQSFSRRIDFSIAASGGQSGSPVLTRANEAAAIFAYGYDGYPVNGGTLIDSARVEFIAENSDMAKPVYRA